MKSTVSNTPCKAELPFPKLMESTLFQNRIVLFMAKGSGTVVARDKEFGYPVGYYTDAWDSNWKDFHGSVCLENGDN